MRKIAAGETWIDNQSVSWVIEAYRAQATSLTSPRSQPKLSKKELAIISCITRGMRNKEIAYQIGTTRAGDQELSAQGVRQAWRLGPAGNWRFIALHHQLLKKYNADGDELALVPEEKALPVRVKA